MRRSRSVVMLVTRNITMKGNSASIAGPIVCEDASVSAKIQATSPISRLGTTSSSAIGARVVADLGEHPAGGGEGARERS